MSSDRQRRVWVTEHSPVPQGNQYGFSTYLAHELFVPEIERMVVVRQSKFAIK